MVFLSIYVREAHPVEGWRMDSNDKAGVTVKQPRTKKERETVANLCSSALEMTMPLLVDELDDRIGHAYSGMPDRLYVIDRDGRVAYKGGRGPFGFKPGEMEQSLAMLLLDQKKEPSSTGPFVPLLDNKAAWEALPLEAKDIDKPLPSWARATARSLPATTAYLLELDYHHRMKSPLDAKLRAQIRWIAARENRCDYAVAQAIKDMRRAGATVNEVRRLTGDESVWSDDERPIMTFARKLTTAAYEVTNDEVEALIKNRGEREVVAIVLLVAYANFQDRLLLSLGLAPKPEYSIAPLDVKVNRQALEKCLDAPAVRAVPPSEIKRERRDEERWDHADFPALQQQLRLQKFRDGRIRVPSWDEVLKRLPTDAPKPARPVRIRWSLVCMGYQPELAAGWGNCTRTFGREAKQDRVFEESLFWVVTRSLQCFY